VLLASETFVHSQSSEQTDTHMRTHNTKCNDDDPIGEFDDDPIGGFDISRDYACVTRAQCNFMDSFV
jgi:hypothetical protein